MSTLTHRKKEKARKMLSRASHVIHARTTVRFNGERPLPFKGFFLPSTTNRLLT